MKKFVAVEHEVFFNVMHRSFSLLSFKSQIKIMSEFSLVIAKIFSLVMLFLVEIFKDLKFCELKERLGHFEEIPTPPPSGGGSRICSITVKID